MDDESGESMEPMEEVPLIQLGEAELERLEPWIPNQDERRVIKMSWSIVSKAAERSSRQRHDIWHMPNCWHG